jgi:hypothetical protein
MANISQFRQPALLSRRTIAVELPEFLLRALECRVTEANADASPDEQITLEHVVEIELAGCLSLAEVAISNESFRASARRCPRG